MRSQVGIRDFIYKNSMILTAVGINILALLFSVFICYPLSETGDDSVMMSIASGGYGEYSSYIVFSNIFYAKVIVTLNAYVGRINWYFAIQFAVVFFSFVSITYVLLKKFTYKLGVVLGTCFLICFSYELYVTYQFTKSAAIATAAGCFILFYFLESEKIKKRWIFSGIALIVVGSLIRFYAFLAVMGVFFILGIIRIILHLKNKQKKRVVLYLCSFFIAVSISFGFYIIDKSIYNNQPEWKEYKEYNSLRSQIRDYPIPVYEDNKAEYAKIGMSRNDYENMMQWNIGDTDYYTVDLFEKILNISPENSEEAKEDSTFLNGVLFYLQEYMETNWSKCFALAFLLILFISKKKKTTVVSGIITLGIIWALSMYLYLQGRYGLQRIELILWLAGFLLLLSINRSYYTWEKIGKAGSCFLMIGVSLLTVLVCFEEYKTNIENKTANIEAKKEVREFYDYIGYDKEKVYLLDATSGYMGEEMGLFEAYTLGYCDNVLGLGGWYTNSPVMKNTQQFYGIENVFADVVNNPDVYIVDKQNIDVEIQYIREHYNPNAYAEEVEVFGVYHIYSVKA